MRPLFRHIVTLSSIFAYFCFVVATHSAAQTLTTLVTFDGTNGQAPTVMTLIQGADGNFYGTTANGGTIGGGTVFQMTPSGTLTTLHSFGFSGSEGSDVIGGLVLGTDGNFYGATYAGGANGLGTIFKITPQGTLTTLHSFSGSDGEKPYGPLVQASDGNFYGTTNYGGTAGYGTFFKITPSGTLTTLYSFCSLSGCTDGGYPHALALGTDGNFYSTTYLGGAGSNGSVFKITPTGTLTTLHSFVGSDGSSPQDRLFQASDGNFWGTTAGGGPPNNGIVFKVTPSGTFTLVYSFCSNNNCLPGAVPFGGVIQGADGNFYGMTTAGGAHGVGAIYALTPQGAATSLHSFCSGSNCSDGYAPTGNLFQASTGIFYGATDQGGTQSRGTIFSLSLPPSFTLTVSTSGSGSVTSTDGFINCPGTCTHSYAPDTQVTLNASPAGGWSFSGWSGACVGVESCNLTMTQNLAVSAYFIQPGPGQGFEFVPAAPCRLVDTRITHNPIQGGTSQSFDVPELGGCGIPTGVAAYSLNVTVVPRGRLGYLAVWPAGLAQPVTSLLNSDGRTKAVGDIVQAGHSDSVSVYASQTTDLILDIDGYFKTTTGQTLQFYPLTPCRVIDTRNANGHLGGPALIGAMERDFPVLESNCIPQNADIQAYSFNVTVEPNPAGQPMSWLELWPQGGVRPTVSTLNNYTGTRVANAAIVPAGNNGQIAVYPSQSTDLIVDINGYFAPAGQDGVSLYPTAPCRVLDTRNGNGAFSGTLIVNVETSPCMPTSAAQTYVFNATVIPVLQLGYLTLWPDGLAQPLASTLNASDGAITSNMAVVPTSNGKVDAYAPQPTQLILDISNYFAP